MEVQGILRIILLIEIVTFNTELLLKVSWRGFNPPLVDKGGLNHML